VTKQDIWMPLYIADYLADTTRLNTEQHGAYLLLIMDYWRNGAPPDEDEVLANITRLTVQQWRKHKPTITRLFTLSEDGNLHHKRIDVELEKAANNKSVKSANGSKGAANKWGINTDAENKQKRSERLANARRLATHSLGEWNALKHICDEQCVRCGSDNELVKDHIQPIYQGGSDGIDNIQPLCRKCNSSKGPEDKDFRPLDWKERLAKCLANDWQTPNPSQSPSLKPSEVTHTVETNTVIEPTLAGRVCSAIKNFYDSKNKPLKGLSQANPKFIACLEAGATVDEFIHAASVAVENGKEFNYIVGIVLKQRQDIANLNLHKGPLPAATHHQAQMQAAAKSFGFGKQAPQLNGINIIDVEEATDD
jgi:uncharacterized protein YdaU (DUF1376 family)